MGVLLAGLDPAVGLRAGHRVGQGGPCLGQALAAGFPAAGVEVEGGAAGGWGQERGLRCHDLIQRRGSDSYSPRDAR